MALRSNAVLIAAVAITAVIVAGLTAVILGEANSRPDLFGNTETAITLRPHGPCELASKATGVIAKKGKKITWTVKNECADTQTVTVGNFRLTDNRNENTTGDCESPGADWPFDQDREQPDNRRTSPGAGAAGHIKLTVKSTTVPQTYYFDVCLGKTKTDPRLIIDP